MRPSGDKKGAELLIFHPNMKIGGAERQISYLVRGLAKRNYKIVVVLYDAIGPLLGDLLQVQNVSIVDLEKRKIGHAILWIRLFKVFRKNRSATVYTFLVGQNVLGLIVGRMCRVSSIVWGNRISSFNSREFGIKGMFSFWMEKMLSPYTDLIIANSHMGLRVQREKGIGPPRDAVIWNGIDTTLYCTNRSVRKKYRSRYNFSEEEIIIGMFCRIVGWKGLEIFLDAARKSIGVIGNIKFVSVGGGSRELVNRYKQLSSDYGLDQRIIWLGEQSDLTGLLNMIDILTVASTSGEGFPNIIGEAMSTERPVVATDVGDNTQIVKGGGLIIPPGDSDAMYHAWKRLVDNKSLRVKMGSVGRQRVCDQFSLKVMIERTESSVFLKKLS